MLKHFIDNNSLKPCLEEMDLKELNIFLWSIKGAGYI
jgi:hypothetical protein